LPASIAASTPESIEKSWNYFKSATDRDPRDRLERDPFGRPMSNNGSFDQGDVKIPDENILQKSRRILDELRRRAGERFRPPIELDYIERLLKRF